MSPLLDYFDLSVLLFICAVVAFLGGLLTFFCVGETKGKQLEQLDADDYSTN